MDRLLALAYEETELKSFLSVTRWGDNEIRTTFSFLCWVLRSSSMPFSVWQVCLFLKKFIISRVTIGEEAELGEAKGKELLRCSLMSYRCKSELFACQSFFIFFSSELNALFSSR